MKRLKKGFTMIELLIVIAVLGVLAVAVLSAINPIEQINRGRDTGSRSDAEQLLSAFDRYYTTQERYPWQDPTGELETTDEIPLTDGAMQVVDTLWVDDAAAPVLAKLTTGGTAELKISFTNRISDYDDSNKLRVYMRGDDGDSVYLCFNPRSGSFAEEARTRCGDAGGLGLPLDLQEAASVVCGADVEDGEDYICLP